MPCTLRWMWVSKDRIFPDSSLVGMIIEKPSSPGIKEGAPPAEVGLCSGPLPLLYRLNADFIRLAILIEI